MRDNRSKPLKDRTFSKILGYNGEHKIYKLDKSRENKSRVLVINKNNKKMRLTIFIIFSMLHKDQTIIWKDWKYKRMNKI